MAAPRRSAKADALWRNAWAGSPHVGLVDTAADKTTGKEYRIIRCPEVQKAHGREAKIADDGRSVHVQSGDQVHFSVIAQPGAALLAANIYRVQLGAKRRKVLAEAGAELEDDMETAAESSLPPALRGKLMGVVLRQGARGDYFVMCPEVLDEFSDNAMVRYGDMPEEVNVGDVINFRICPPIGGQSMPEAEDVEKITGDEAKAVVASCRRKGKGKGKGKGKDLFFLGGGHRAGKGKRKGAPTNLTKIRMTGIVKRRSEKNKMHPILCQDVSDVYGRDAVIPKWEEPESGLSVGDRVAFDVEEHPEGYTGPIFAFNVKIAGRGALGKRSAGDGEDEGGEDLELEERDEDEEAERLDEDEPALQEEELREAADDEAWLDPPAELGEPEERQEKAAEPLRRPQRARPPAPRGAATQAQVAQALAHAQREASEKALAFAYNTPSTADWEAAQEKLFGRLPKLPQGWIRIMSKSKGEVYFYNTQTGVSSEKQPRQ